MTSRAQVLVKCVSYWSKVKFRVERRLENRWAGGRGEQVGGGGGGGVPRSQPPQPACRGSSKRSNNGPSWSKLVKTGQNWLCRGVAGPLLGVQGRS